MSLNDPQGTGIDMTSQNPNGRVVHEIVDEDGAYFSRIAAGGPYVFFAGPAVDHTGSLAAEARVKPPYHNSASANVRAQSRYIWQRYKDALTVLGSSVNDVVQVEQYIQHKIHADGYLMTSRGPGFMERGRPGSALIATGDFAPEGCVVNPTGIAVIPTDKIAKEIIPVGDQDPGKRPEFGGAYAQEPVYNELVTAGQYVFTVGDTVIEYGVGIHDDAKVASWIWWGNEARTEAQYIWRMLRQRLEKAGTLLENVVHVTVFLIDTADQFEFDLVWQETFPVDPPTRTIVPVRGLGLPRHQGPTTHAEGAMKMEAMCQSVRPGFGVKREVISTGITPLMHESEAIRARPLLWTSGIIAADADGLKTGSAAASQLGYIFNRLDKIWQAGGTSLQNLLRLRAYVTDVRDTGAVYAALKRAVPSNPPCVAISGVPGPLQFPEATVVVDAVAYVPD
jgi:enamine deaminase RidA (YjgF/YER057c/UK114 family)